MNIQTSSNPVLVRPTGSVSAAPVVGTAAVATQVITSAGTAGAASGSATGIAGGSVRGGAPVIINPQSANPAGNVVVAAPPQVSSTPVTPVVPVVTASAASTPTQVITAAGNAVPAVVAGTSVPGTPVVNNYYSATPAGNVTPAVAPAPASLSDQFTCWLSQYFAPATVPLVEYGLLGLVVVAVGYLWHKHIINGKKYKY